MDHATGTADPVVVHRLRWPDRPLRSHLALPLGSDRWGRWFRVAAGDDMGSSEGYDWAAEHDAVLLLPDRGWWAAYWSTYGTVYVDVALVVPPGPAGPVVIDLDLDVVVDLDGSVRVDDVEEFERHRVELGYPQWVVDGAHAGRDDVLARLRHGDEPFGSVGPARADGLADVGGPSGA